MTASSQIENTAVLMPQAPKPSLVSPILHPHRKMGDALWAGGGFFTNTKVT